MRRISSLVGWALALLVALMPVTKICASSREADTRRALRNVEHLNREQRSAVEGAKRRATLAATEALRLAQERVSTSAKLQEMEAATADISARIDALAQWRRALEQKVQTRTRAMRPLLPLIERLSLHPAGTLLAVPAPPSAAVRGVLILQGFARQMEIETEALRRDKMELTRTTNTLLQEAPRLAQAEAAEKREAAILDQEITAAHAQQATAEAQETQAASQAAEAAAHMNTLHSALVALEAQRHADQARAREESAHAERQQHRVNARAAHAQEAVAAHPTGANTTSSDASPRGQLQPPVIGVVVQSWGEQTDGGPATGVSYHAPPGAIVISPCGGRAVFAEDFRSYGLLLIINCGGGYDAVLSGFDRLNVKLGQSLVMGEPVGVMPTWTPGSLTTRPVLHVELRHDGTPMNPFPLLRSHSGLDR